MDCTRKGLKLKNSHYLAQSTRHSIIRESNSSLEVSSTSFEKRPQYRTHFGFVVEENESNLKPSTYSKYSNKKSQQTRLNQHSSESSISPSKDFAGGFATSTPNKINSFSGNKFVGKPEKTFESPSSSALEQLASTSKFPSPHHQAENLFQNVNTRFSLSTSTPSQFDMVQISVGNIDWMAEAENFIPSHILEGQEIQFTTSLENYLNNLQSEELYHGHSYDENKNKGELLSSQDLASLENWLVNFQLEMLNHSEKEQSVNTNNGNTEKEQQMKENDAEEGDCIDTKEEQHGDMENSHLKEQHMNKNDLKEDYVDTEKQMNNIYKEGPHVGKNYAKKVLCVDSEEDRQVDTDKSHEKELEMEENDDKKRDYVDTKKEQSVKDNNNVEEKQQTEEKDAKDADLYDFNKTGYPISQRRLNKKSFKCEIRALNFTQKHDLNRYLTIHTGKKSFKCKICSKQFKRKHHLKEHLIIHTGEKPFKCAICYKAFSRNNYLNEHLKIHIGEKPFKCEKCFKQFTRNQYLKKHLKIHTGEKPFKCKLCLKRFKQKQYLKRHLKIHTNEKSFKRAFTKKQNTNLEIKIILMKTYLSVKCVS